MQALGEYLKKIRIEKRLSLNTVYRKTGITDSRLSKAENGAWHNLKISDVKKLAELYDISVVHVCLETGLFTELDIQEYHSGFRNAALLDDDERQHIQSEIDYFVKKKEG